MYVFVLVVMIELYVGVCVLCLWNRYSSLVLSLYLWMLGWYICIVW